MKKGGVRDGARVQAGKLRYRAHRLVRAYMHTIGLRRERWVKGAQAGKNVGR